MDRPPQRNTICFEFVVPLEKNSFGPVLCHFNPIYVDLSTQPLIPIMVFMQKIKASKVSQFVFGGPFLDEKSNFQKVNFYFFVICAKNLDNSKKSDGNRF